MTQRVEVACQACRAISRPCSKDQGRPCAGVEQRRTHAAPETPEKLSELTIDGLHALASNGQCTPIVQRVLNDTDDFISHRMDSKTDDSSENVPSSCPHCSLLEHALVRERAEHATNIKRAISIVNSLEDELVQSQAESDVLRDRVAFLEAVHTLPVAPSPDQGGQKSAEVVAALQLEIANLQRQLEKLQKSRSALAESEAAAQQRCQILSHQVDHLAAALDAACASRTET
jgi:cell division protein FtsB